jgi:hypothetical protein
MAIQSRNAANKSNPIDDQKARHDRETRKLRELERLEAQEEAERVEKEARKAQEENKRREAEAAARKAQEEKEQKEAEIAAAKKKEEEIKENQRREAEAAAAKKKEEDEKKHAISVLAALRNTKSSHKQTNSIFENSAKHMPMRLWNSEQVLYFLETRNSDGIMDPMIKFLNAKPGVVIENFLPSLNQQVLFIVLAFSFDVCFSNFLCGA